MSFSLMKEKIGNRLLGGGIKRQVNTSYLVQVRGLYIYLWLSNRVYQFVEGDSGPWVLPLKFTGDSVKQLWTIE